MMVRFIHWAIPGASFKKTFSMNRHYFFDIWTRQIPDVLAPSFQKNLVDNIYDCCLPCSYFPGIPIFYPYIGEAPAHSLACMHGSSFWLKRFKPHYNRNSVYKCYFFNVCFKRRNIAGQSFSKDFKHFIFCCYLVHGIGGNKSGSKKIKKSRKILIQDSLHSFIFDIPYFRFIHSIFIYKLKLSFEIRCQFLESYKFKERLTTYNPGTFKEI